MIVNTAARVASRQVPRNAAKQQRRGIIDYLTKYPDKVMETKKIQCKGGVQQGADNPTWLKQDGDKAVFGLGVGLSAIALVQLTVGHYRVATGTGKLD